MNKHRIDIILAWVPVAILALALIIHQSFKIYDINSVCEVINPPNGREYLCGSGYASAYLSLLFWLVPLAFLVASVKFYKVKFRVGIMVKVGYFLTAVILLFFFIGIVYLLLNTWDYP